MSHFYSRSVCSLLYTFANAVCQRGVFVPPVAGAMSWRNSLTSDETKCICWQCERVRWRFWRCTVVCQHRASNSGFLVTMQGNGINLYGVFQKKTYARNNTRRWWTRATLRKRTTRSESCLQSYWESLRTAKVTRS